MSRPPSPLRTWASSPLLAVGLAGTACAAASPFEGPGYDRADGVTTAADGPFVAVVTHTRMAEGARDAFDAHVEAVVDQASDAPGFVGSSLRGEIFGRERWTLTVWETDADLGTFYGSGAHAEAMRDAHDVIDAVYSHRFEVDRAAMPPRWGETLRLLDRHEPVDPW